MVAKNSHSDHKEHKHPHTKPDELEKELLKQNAQPDELKKKVEHLKKDLDKFQQEILKKFEKYVIGLAIFPPDKNAKPEDKDNINIFILADDSDSKTTNKKELGDKLFAVIDKIAQDINEKIYPQVMLLSELRETCYDGKYDVIQLIGLSAILYDKGMLGAIKVSEIHKNMSIKKFERYVLSYVAAGSLFRGDANPHDIDVFIIIDDTDVKRMSRIELRDRLRNIILSMGAEASAIAGVKAQFHIQTYILTDFWDNIKEANPVIYTFLRDGVPLYDRGMFMPWKILLKMGRLRPSQEAIDLNMDLGERLIDRTKQKLVSIIADDLYYALLNPAQAALMLYGLAPPTPKETIKLMEEIFVKKEKILEQKYVNVLAKAQKYFKGVEHQTIKEISGKEVDQFLKDAESYLKRIKKLFDQIDKKTQKAMVQDTYDEAISAAKDALEFKGVKGINSTNVHKKFKKELVDNGIFTEKTLRILELVIKTKEDYTKKKITKQEIEKADRESKELIRIITSYLQRSRAKELDRAKIRFQYENITGEVLLLGEKAYLTENIEKPEVLQVAQIEQGHLKNLRKTTLTEFEKTLKETNIPPAVFINETIFSDLKQLFGKNIKIMIGSQ